MRYENEVVKVDKDNIEEVKSIIVAEDQRVLIKPGDIITTYPIRYGPAEQRGQVTIWWNSEEDAMSPDLDVVKGRAAICTEGPSVWGDYLARRSDGPRDQPYLITKEGDAIRLGENQAW
jgi:hypothetical protein